MDESDSLSEIYYIHSSKDHNVVHTQPPKLGLLGMRRSKSDRIYEVTFVGYTSDRTSAMLMKYDV
jgi:hypothetical protein